MHVCLEDAYNAMLCYTSQKKTAMVLKSFMNSDKSLTFQLKYKTPKNH